MSFRNYLTESSIKQYIKSMLKMITMQENPNPYQLKFWKWQDKNAKPVKVSSYHSDPTLEALINKELHIKSPKVKECYRNAFMVAVGQPDIDIVVGYVLAAGIAPTEHAWNYYKPKKMYFDLTGELCLHNKVERETYLKIIDLPANKAMSILTSNNFSMLGFLGAWFDMNEAEQIHEIYNLPY